MSEFRDTPDSQGQSESNAGHLGANTGRVEPGTNQAGPDTGQAARLPAFSGAFRPGDRVQLTGPKGRRNTITLASGEVFHTQRGGIPHDELIGSPDGSVVTSSGGVEYLALRPLLEDFVMSMPRGAAIIYPKDATAILAKADIFPGATVVEAGVGSGALSLWLLRALGSAGTLLSFERREEFADIARGNVTAFFGYEPKNWSVTLGDLSDALPLTAAGVSVDRVVLDMLAPWECVEAVSAALKPGGVLLGYVATVTQLSRFAEAIRATELFTHPNAEEIMVRGWHVEGLAVRPEHRMIGHTGFLLSARRLAGGARLPQLKRRSSKSDYEQDDVTIWTPETEWSQADVGEMAKSAKILRKKAREAGHLAQRSRERQGVSPGEVDSDTTEAVEVETELTTDKLTDKLTEAGTETTTEPGTGWSVELGQDPEVPESPRH